MRRFIALVLAAVGCSSLTEAASGQVSKTIEQTERALDVWGLSADQTVAVSRRYAALRAQIEEIQLSQEASDTATPAQFTNARESALVLLEGWVAEIKEELTEEQWSIAPALAVALDPWRYSPVDRMFLCSAGRLPAAEPRILLELQLPPAESRRLIEILYPAALARHRQIETAVARFVGTRRTLYEVLQAGKQVPSSLESRLNREGRDVHSLVLTGESALSLLRAIETRDPGMLYLALAVTAQQSIYLLDEMQELCGRLRPPIDSGTPFWEDVIPHLLAVTEAIDAYLAVVDSWHGSTGLLYDNEVARARWSRLRKEELTLREIIRATPRGEDADAAVIAAPLIEGHAFYLEAARPVADRVEEGAIGSGSTENVNVSPWLLKVRATSATLKSVVDVHETETWDLSGCWMAMDFLGLAASMNLLPVEDEAVVTELLSVREARISRWRSTSRLIDSAVDLMQLADREYASLAQLLAEGSSELSRFQACCERQANPLVAAEISSIRAMVKARGDEVSLDLAVALDEWRKAARRTIGWDFKLSDAEFRMLMLVPDRDDERRVRGRVFSAFDFKGVTLPPASDPQR